MDSGRKTRVIVGALLGLLFVGIENLLNMLVRHRFLLWRRIHTFSTMPTPIRFVNRFEPP